MARVTCPQVIGASGISTFEKNIVVRIRRYLWQVRGSDKTSMILD
jgi:hypothetical protein